jgi:hypothetical protein
MMERVRSLTRPMRAIFAISSVFVFIAGIQLYALSQHTDFWFAWTIDPPLTAAFVGSLYLAATVLALSGARQRDWDQARVWVPAILVFIWLTLIATIVHLDKFHLEDSALVPTAAAWAWLGVYFIEPPVFSIIYRQQLRAPGSDRPCIPEIAGWFRTGSAALGLFLIGIGGLLFAAPSTSAHVWPWELTPLTARASGAWLVAIGLIEAMIGRETCWARVRWSLVSIATGTILVAVALARYSEDFRWETVPGVIFLAVLAMILAAASYGLTQARRS